MSRLPYLALAIPLLANPALAEPDPDSKSKAEKQEQAPGTAPEAPETSQDGADSLDATELGWVIIAGSVAAGTALVTSGLLEDCDAGEPCETSSAVLLGAGLALGGTTVGILLIQPNDTPSGEPHDVVAPGIRWTGRF